VDDGLDDEQRRRSEQIRREFVAKLERNPNLRRTLELIWEGKDKSEIERILSRKRRMVDLYFAEINQAMTEVVANVLGREPRAVDLFSAEVRDAVMKVVEGRR